MAQTIATTAVFVETVSGATHTDTVTVPSGTKRKAVVGVTQEVAQTLDALTFNGTTFLANLCATKAHATATELRINVFYYDIPDALAAGDYDVVLTTSGSTTNVTLRTGITTGSALGAPEDTDTQEGTSAANALTGSLDPTDGAAVFAYAVDSAAGLTSMEWTGTTGVVETDEQNETNYTSSAASAIVATGGAGLTAIYTPNTTAQDANKVLVVVSFAASVGPTVTSLDVEEGTADGGTAVTITGTNFDDTGGASEGVTFGGTAATSVVFVNSTTITCVTPAHAAGLVDVVVTNGDATSDTLTDGFLFGDVDITQPGSTNGAGAASGTLTSTLYALSGLAKRAVLTTVVGGVTLEAKRGIKLTEPA